MSPKPADVHAVDAMLDLALETDLAAEFLTPERDPNDEWMAEMMSSPYVIPGVSDGGAHTKFFVGGSYPTDFLMWLVRDTGRMTLEEAHYRLSYLPARAAGFRDRGMLTEGAPADVVVYDLDALNIIPGWARRDRARLPRWRVAAHSSAPTATAGFS